jgi:hypothetical protein
MKGPRCTLCGAFEPDCACSGRIDPTNTSPLGLIGGFLSGAIVIVIVSALVAWAGWLVYRLGDYLWNLLA